MDRFMNRFTKWLDRSRMSVNRSKKALDRFGPVHADRSRRSVEWLDRFTKRLGPVQMERVDRFMACPSRPT